MSKGPDHFIMFRSNLFSMEGRDHYINPCCFCEDLAEWLGKSLSAALPTMALDVYQEDFGWVVDLHPQEATCVIMVVAQTFLTNEDESSDDSASTSGIERRASCAASFLRCLQPCRRTKTLSSGRSTPHCMPK
jgi:hypothetical protein